jgi:hypothetical protein
VPGLRFFDVLLQEVSHHLVRCSGRVNWVRTPQRHRLAGLLIGGNLTALLDLHHMVRAQHPEVGDMPLVEAVVDVTA